MLKTKQTASSRRGQRLKPGPFSNKSTKTKAQVQLNRLGQQLKKKLRHGNATDIIDSVKSEVGWLGLCIVFFCVISVCYIIITVVGSGSNSSDVPLERLNNRVHPDNDDPLHIDPEQWPHHLSKDKIKRRNANDRVNNIDEILARSDRKRERRDRRQNERNPRENDGNERENLYENDERNQRRHGRGNDGNERENIDERNPQENDGRNEIKRDEINEEMNLHDRNRMNRPRRSRERKRRGRDKDKEIEIESMSNAQKEIKVEDESMTEESNWNKAWNIIQTTTNESSLITDAFTVEELEEKAYEIKAAFLYAWHGYSKYALGHDEIHPVSDLPGDSWGGLGATLIDALDTMMLMGIKEEYVQARQKLNEIHFDIDLQVSFFETIIRHLGGLISAYEMSVVLGNEDKFMLEQCVSLANHLLPAFDTAVGVPKSMVNLKTREIKNYGWTKDKSILSEIGSNQVEFTVLSAYTNDGKYFNKSINVFKLLDSRQQNSEGLFPRLINTNDGSFPKNERVYSFGGMSDSFYETLLKQWILTGYTHKLSLKLYMQAINAANEKLLRVVWDKNRREQPYFFYGEQWYGKFRGKMEELQCFMPGVLALGAYHASIIESKSDLSALTESERQLIRDKDKHMKLAKVLVSSCYAMYEEMPTGLAPESIAFSDDSWKAKEMRYQLRPETLESLFILYSLTGDEQYRVWGWNIFLSIQKYCKTDAAFSGINDVSESNPTQDNQMQSYVMAETFKYLFLMFDTYARELLPLDKIVFNTEAHPIKIINDIEKFEWYSA